MIAVCVCRAQRVSNPLELELQEVVTQPMWVLGTELWPLEE